MSKYIYSDRNGIAVVGEPTMVDGNMMGGHKYRLAGLLSKPPMELVFQTGSVKVNGTNGWTTEGLLAVLIDRTRLLDTLAPCVQNRMAIKAMEDALVLFEARTKDRVERGVEGESVS